MSCCIVNHHDHSKQQQLAPVIVIVINIVFLWQNLNSCSCWMKADATMIIAYAPMIGVDQW